MHIHNLCHADIGPLGKERVIFKMGSQHFHGDDVHVVDKENAMRIAHADCNRVAKRS